MTKEEDPTLGLDTEPEQRRIQRVVEGVGGSVDSPILLLLP